MRAYLEVYLVANTRIDRSALFQKATGSAVYASELVALAGLDVSPMHTRSNEIVI